MGIIKLKNQNDNLTDEKKIEEKDGKVFVDETNIHDEQDVRTEELSQVATQQDIEIIGEKIADGDSEEQIERWDDPAILYEDESKIDETTRHYVLNNGTMKTIVASEPTSFYDDDTHKWMDIDNSLEENEEYFESKKGKRKARIYKTANGKKVVINKSDKSISWEFLGKNPVGGAENKEQSILRVKNKVKKSASSAIYEHADKNTDLEYCFNGNNVKENIIVKEKSDEYKYVFALKSEGLKLRLSENNDNIELYSEKANEKGEIESNVEFVIPSPYMYDANGSSSEDVYYELEPNGNGNYLFAVIANKEWINAEERMLPVVIDPQITTSHNSCIEKQTYRRTVSANASCGTCYGNWYLQSIANIKMKKSSTEEYETNLTIKKSLLNIMEATVSSVKLKLTPEGTFAGRLICDGKSIDYNSNNGKLTVDITEKFTKSVGDFSVMLQAGYSGVDMEFSMAGEAPVIEIEYLTNENIHPTKKEFSLAEGVTGEVNLANGNMVVSFCDVKPEDSVMGMGVYHIYKRNGEDNSAGDGFRLNLNETFEKFSDSNYIYTDAKGDKHGFRAYYYYINSFGTKTYILASGVTVDAEGKMTHDFNGQTYNVECEYRSTAGLKAMTTIDGVKNVKYLEQRTDEYKQVETAFNEYDAKLKEFVRLDANTGCINKRLSSYLFAPSRYENFTLDLLDNEMILPESEAMVYRSALLQISSLREQNNAYDNEKESIGLQLDSIDNKNAYMQNELSNIVNQRNSINTQKELLQIQRDYYDNAEEELNSEGQTTYSNDYYTSLKELNPTQVSDLNSQDAYLDNKYDETSLQYAELEDQKAILEAQEDYIDTMKRLNAEQITHYEQQMAGFRAKKQYYLDQLHNLFVEYLAIEKEYKNIQHQMPVNFLSDGTYIKGYNKFGKFVALYDRYDNYTVIEYEIFYDGMIEKNRISRIYDNTEKQVVFTYNESNQLVSITDVRGRKTSFVYNDGNKLTKISTDTGKVIGLSYTGNNLYSINDNKNAIKSVISYAYSRPISIYKYSMVDSISLKEATAREERISKILISYNPYNNYPIESTTITDDIIQERYYFDEDGQCAGYRKAENNVVVDAEQYEFTPYWNGFFEQTDPKQVVIKANKDTLYKSSIDSFVFENGDTETVTIDQFNNPVRKTTSAILIAKWEDESGVEQENWQTTTVDYTYDDNQKLVQEKSTVTFSNPAETIISYKKYNYNIYGDVIRTESYVAGEEYTLGKTIEETVYDEKGNVTKSFTYNSLDTSTKFYSETEYDEKGTVLAEVDSTGENKTKFGYVDGTNVVREETLPNGSKFVYGHDSDDSINAISQSTEEGEENSTQKVYRCGQVVEVKSGNNSVKYVYNAKRKVTSIDLNGEPEYVKFEYVENVDSSGVVVTEKTIETYNSGDVFVSELDRKGHLLSLTANQIEQINNVYDKEDNLVSSRDNISGRVRYYGIDEFNRIAKVTEKDENGTFNHYETNAYDEHGRVIKKNISGSINQQYLYSYKNDSSRSLESIQVGNVLVKPQTDIHGRNKGRELYVNNIKLAEENISYRKVGDHATNMPSTVWFGDKSNGSYQVKDSLKYAYDKMGNIEKIYENGELAIRYQYDALNRLIREDNKVLNKTVLFVYDNNGNILKQREFLFTLKNATDIEELDSLDKVYVYDGDRLLSFNGEDCTSEYDETTKLQTKYRGKTLSWLNRRVSSYNGVTFGYDGYGRRISKGDITYTYDSEDRLLKQSNGLEFVYDHSGISTVKYNGNTYFYRKDALGNVIALLDINGSVVVKYLYDAWGNHAVVDVNGNIITDETHIGNVNPFRYRSYYYDTETNLYFLKTRFYDSETGRFISQDSVEYLDPETINGLNLYAYCGNNPIMRVDPNGTSWLMDLLIGIAVVFAIAVTVVASVVTFGAAATFLAIGIGVAISVGSYVIGTAATGGDFTVGGFVGAIVGGIVGGVLSLTSFGTFVTAMASGFANSFVTDYSEHVFDSKEFKFEESVADSIVVGVFSGLLSWGMSKIPISGLNSGRGSFKQVFNQINTKLTKGIISRVSFKSFMKMFCYQGNDSLGSFFTDIIRAKIFN